MKVYHGSTAIVQKPDVTFGRTNLDFGTGFYTTDKRMQAERWVQRFIHLGKRSFINIYNFDDTNLPLNCKYKHFLKYDEEWLDFIISCRHGGKDYLNYNVIEGGIANDKVFNTIELYFDNLIDKQEALKRLIFEKPNNQICFISQDIMNKYLHFEKAEEVFIESK